MKRMILSVLAAWCAGAATTFAQADRSPEFREVEALVRSNLVGVTDADLGHTALEELLRHLHPRVVLVTNAVTDAVVVDPSSRVPEPRLFDSVYGYLRIAGVEPGLEEVLRRRLDTLTATNRLDGLVLDLRFTGGSDCREAAQVASLFLSDERPLLACGADVIRSAARTNAFDCPVAVLVNRETSGAAAALAALLRRQRAGLVIGTGPTAPAALDREFVLSTGQRLRIAARPIRFGDGSEIPAAGVQPDIDVVVPVEDDRLFLDDPYRVVSTAQARDGRRAASAAATNRPTRLTEADLVRMRREGLSRSRSAEPEVRPVTDPVLVRGLDLLKGLAILRPKPRP